MKNRVNGWAGVAGLAARAGLAAVVSASMVLSGSPLVPAACVAFAAGAGASADGAAGTESWTDRIGSMLSAGDYNEGEVVAIVAPAAEYAAAGVAADGEASGKAAADSLLDVAQTEELAQTDGDVYEGAFGEALPAAVVEGARIAAAADGADEEVAVQAADVDVYTLLVKRDGMSTEQILRELAGDARVLWAEPNYTWSVDDADGSGGAVGSEVAASDADLAAALSSDAGSGSDPADKITPVTPSKSEVASSGEVADGTSFQWAYSEGEGAAYGDLHASGLTVNDPDWNDASKTNSAGVIAIVDTGIDYANPDLEDAMFDMSGYVARLGGDAHGYNATLDGGDSGDVQGHGTHCAGIAAASWNGYGVSGAANGAKLISVRAATNEGLFSSVAAVRAFEYIGRAVDAGVDIRVVSNSWGGEGGCRAQYLATEALGRKGVAAVFASGNDGAEVDKIVDTAKVEGASDYVTVVNSAAMTGAASSFSNWGATTTDVYAPGSSILSTAISQGSKATASFLPSLLENKDDLVLYEDFSGNEAQVEAWTGIKQYGSGHAKKGKIGGLDSATVGFDAEPGVLRVSKEELEAVAKDSGEDAVLVSLKVPVDAGRLDELSNVAFSLALSGAKPNESLQFSTFVLDVVDADGNVKTAGNLAGVASADQGWTVFSTSVASVLSEAGEGYRLAVHTDADGNSYIWAHFAVSMEVLEETSADGLLFDCVGAGNKLVPYMYASGTSMATPCVAGLAAVASEQMGGYGELDRSVRAAALTRVLKASVTSSDAFDGRCTSNGFIDASKFAASEGRAPVIASASLSADGKSLVIKGDSFGSSAGSVKFGEKDAGVVSWSDGEVVVSRPDGLVSGYLKVALTTAAGKSCAFAQTYVFATDVSADELPVFEESIDVPEALGNCDCYNTIAALDGSLYVFGSRNLDNDELVSGQQQSLALVYELVWRYDIASGSWSQVENLPCRLANVSWALWEGKLLVMGAAWSEGYGHLATKKLFSLDPATGKWTDLSEKVAGDDVPYQASIVNVGGRLLIIGGSVVAQLPASEEAAAEQGVWVSLGYTLEAAQSVIKSDSALMTLTRDNVREFDLADGKATVIGSCLPRSNAGLVRGESDIQAAVCGSELYLTGGAKLNVFSPTTDEAQATVERLTLKGDGSVSRESVGTLGGTEDTVGGVPASMAKFANGVALAGAQDGPVLAGVFAVNGFGEDGIATDALIQADTYQLKSGASAFTGIGKRGNYTPIAYARAIAYRGKLYVLGHDYYNSFEPVMRATSIATDELAGDVSGGEAVPNSEKKPQAASTKTAAGRLPRTGDAALRSVPLGAALVGGAALLVARRLRS